MHLVFFTMIIVVTQITRVSCSSGIGFAFSGAGARIGQHIALAQALIEGTYPKGKPLRPSYLSGASSGAISSILVNAVIESQETKRINWSWDHIKELLFQFQSSDVYDDSSSGIVKIPVNIAEGFILDNTPLVNFLGSKFQEMGYYTFGDLYIPTAISIMNQSSGETLRLWSDDPKYSNIPLVDLVVASASIPLTFPLAKIRGLGDSLWIDGGTGTDTLPVNALLTRPQVSSLYIVCYGSALTHGGSTVPPALDHVLILKNLLATWDDIRVDLFIGALEEVSVQTAKPAFSYIPNLNQTFSVLDFDSESLQYDLTLAWAKQNSPKALNSHKPFLS